MKKWIITKESKYTDKWDVFVLNNISGSFLQTMDRVKSYEQYGFDWELIICVDNEDNILAGSVNIVVKFLFLKMYICSYGPTYTGPEIQEGHVDAFLTQFVQRAKELKVCASQITLPTDISSIIKGKGSKGKLFNKIPSVESYNLINLRDDNDTRLDYESIIKSFSKKARRDVRASYRRGLTIKLAVKESELRLAYSCFEDNAGSKGYSVRSWEEFSATIISMSKSGHAYLLTAWYNDEIQGAILVERSSDALHYTMGGVHRHSPDLNTGYFLQMEGMLLASEKNCKFYDISCGGPPAVKKFKESFNPIFTDIGETIHFVHNYFITYLYKILYKYVGSYFFQKIRYLKIKLSK